MERTFGSILIELRNEKGLTQAELGEMVGVTDKAVSKWERDLSLPDIEMVKTLAEIFDKPVEDLLTNEDPEKIIIKQCNASTVLNVALIASLGASVISKKFLPLSAAFLGLRIVSEFKPSGKTVFKIKIEK